MFGKHFRLIQGLSLRKAGKESWLVKYAQSMYMNVQSQVRVNGSFQITSGLNVRPFCLL